MKTKTKEKLIKIITGIVCYSLSIYGGIYVMLETQNLVFGGIIIGIFMGAYFYQWIIDEINERNKNAKE